jgi:hypothetical protein
VKALALLALLAACDQPPHRSYETERPPFSDQHARALRAMGIKDAKPAEYPPFVCGRDDSALNSAGFKADGAKGMVCCGWFKGCTVRIQ